MDTKGMRVALYARVSTKQHGQDPETQLLPLRAYALSRGLQIIDEYVDLGWSGSKERRPQLDRLMADAKKHRFDAVMVARFDRFARSTKHLLTALGEFKASRIDFISLNENIDTSTAVGKMVFTLIAAIAEFERELIRERVKAGVDRAKKQGKKLGRPTVLVDKQSIVDRIRAGESIKSVAKSAGIARGTIRKIIATFAVLPGENALLEGGKSPSEEVELKH